MLWKLLFVMLNRVLYNIGKTHNNVMKYTIEYDSEEVSDFVCAAYIYSLLNSNYSLTPEQENKLNLLLNNLCAL